MKRIVRFEITMTVHDPELHENAYREVKASQASKTPDGFTGEDWQQLTEQITDEVLKEEGFIEMTRREMKNADR